MKNFYLVLSALLFSLTSFAVAPITGTMKVCPGTTTTLSDITPSGTWSSSNTLVATVGSSSGKVSGVAAGTAVVTYDVSGIYAIAVVTVNPLPAPITGVAHACIGFTSTLSDGTPSGVWSSADTTVAKVVPGTGVVTGIAATTVDISYTLTTTGCYTSETFTTTPLPGPITGIPVMCVGTQTTLYGVGSGTWTSGNTSVATIDAVSGVATGVTAGSATMTYSLLTGCLTTSAVTVNPNPVAISGISPVCVGTCITVSDASTGGTWLSENGAIASAGIFTGTVCGISGGVDTIIYTLPTGCLITGTVLVNPSPGAITGSSTVCIGSAITLSDPGGGTWTTGATTVSISSGLVTGLSAGTAKITYSLPTGCTTTKVITVYNGPVPITGSTTICVGATTVLSDGTAGGTWASGNTTVASVVSSGGGAGTTTGWSLGTATLTYRVFSTGCVATTTVTVSSAPSIIAGATVICTGSTTTLSDAVTGGTWSSASSNVSVGITSGVITGLSVGTALITYSLGTGCTATITVTITSAPSAILGIRSLCGTSVTTLTDAISGGTWSTTSSAVTVGLTSGIVSGVTPGPGIITYSLGTGCSVATTVTVYATPSSIAGVSYLCASGTTTLTDTTAGGTWSSSNTVVATVSSGIVSGVSAGSATISYTVAGGCYVTDIVTVYSMPSTISGSPVACSGATTTLSDTYSGGTWSSSNTSVATVGSSSGVVTGISTGTTTITYTTTGGCSVTALMTDDAMATPVVTVIASPGDTVCPGTTVFYSVASFYGGPSPAYTWYVNSVIVGTLSTYSYMPADGDTVRVLMSSDYACRLVSAVYSSNIMRVNLMPPVTGTGKACTGASTTLSDATGGGTWSSSNSSIATIGSSSGIATGIGSGTATIRYLLPTGCYATTTVTINALPTIAASSSSACGDTYTLTATGGTSYSWAPVTGLSCSTCATTTVNPSATTTFTATGTDIAGCVNTAFVTVNGNRIFGHIDFTSYTPDTLDMKVWLIQFNPADSSIYAVDSTTTCAVDSIDYYEFDGVPAGNYLVKAMLLYGNPPGASGYVPTYGTSSPYWYSASTITHASGSDSLHIDMAAGTVPAGPGFIGGYVYAGAGKGTDDGIPVAGMLIYLQNTATQILTYTYTDGTGYYSFSGIDYGDYVIYPEAYSYYTTASADITVSATSQSVNNIDFKQYLNSKVILPLDVTHVMQTSASRSLTISPNPASDVLNIDWTNEEKGHAAILITDVMGREVYRSVLQIDAASGQSQIGLSGLQSGVYVVSVKSDNFNYNGKLTIQK